MPAFNGSRSRSSLRGSMQLALTLRSLNADGEEEEMSSVGVSTESLDTSSEDTDVSRHEGTAVPEGTDAPEEGDTEEAAGGDEPANFLNSIVHLLGRDPLDLHQPMWFEVMLCKVRNLPGIRHLRATLTADDEVLLTQSYAKLVKSLEETAPGEMHTARSMEGAQLPLAPTSDIYQHLTWQWVKTRCTIEEQSVGASEETGFYVNMLQTAVTIALCIFAFAQTETSDSLLFYVTAGLIGAVGILSGSYGLYGCITLSQRALRRYFALQCLLMQVVGVHLIILGGDVFELDSQCDPTKGSFAVSEPSCEPARVWLGIAITLTCLSLLLCLVSLYNTMSLIDGLSDHDSVKEELRMFSYFQRKLDETAFNLQHMPSMPHERRHRSSGDLGGDAQME